MPDFDSHAFVEVATELATMNVVGDRQAYWRTAVGRAYYAAYGLVRKSLIQKHSHAFGKSGKHGKMMRAFLADSGNSRLNEVGQWMKLLMESRVKADYQWQATSNLEEAEVEDAIDAANAVLLLIQQLTPGDWLRMHQEMIK